VSNIGDTNFYSTIAKVWARRAPSSCPDMKDHAGMSIKAADEEILVAGGVASFGPRREAKKYVPDFWQFRTSIPEPARGQSVGFGMNGVGFIVGGDDGDSTPAINDVDKFFPSTNNWSAVGNALPEALGESAGFVLDGVGWYHGGQSNSSETTNRFFRFSGFGWQNHPTPPSVAGNGQRGHAAFGVERDFQGYIVSGTWIAGVPNLTAEVHRWDTVAETWTTAGFIRSISGARVYLSAAAFDNRGFVHAGLNAGGFETSEHDEYNPITNAWTSHDDMPLPVRQRQAAASLGDT